MEIKANLHGYTITASPSEMSILLFFALMADTEGCHGRTTAGIREMYSRVTNELLSCEEHVFTVHADEIEQKLLRG